MFTVEELNYLCCYRCQMSLPDRPVSSDLLSRWCWFMVKGAQGTGMFVSQGQALFLRGCPRLRPGPAGSAPGGQAGVWMSGCFNQPGCSFWGFTCWCSHFLGGVCVLLWPDFPALWSVSLRLQTHLIQLSSSTCWLRGPKLQNPALPSKLHSCACAWWGYLSAQKLKFFV